MQRINWRSTVQLAAAMVMAGAVGMMIGQGRPAVTQLGPLVVQPQCSARATALALAAHYQRADTDRRVTPRSIGNYAEEVIEEYIDEAELPRDAATNPGDGYALAVAYQALLVREKELPGPGRTAEFAAAMTTHYRSEAKIGRKVPLDAADGAALLAAYQAVRAREDAPRLSPRLIGEFAGHITEKFGK